jgi:hypothetical protein
MAVKSQRQMMRELHRRYGDDAERIIREYAAAERRGEVPRRSDSHGLTAEQYARALWSDGMRKGWLVSTDDRSRSMMPAARFDRIADKDDARPAEPAIVVPEQPHSVALATTEQFPVERIRAAVAAGHLVLRSAGLEPEHPDVALAVERHRWAWKPDAVRVLLVAESHVYTTADDFALRIQPQLLPSEARHAPTEYVRLVYCLGYGESELLTGSPVQSNYGTPQYWNIFGRLAGTGQQPGRSEGLTRRLRWKLKTLNALQTRGVWLLDACLHAIYTPGAMRLDRGVFTNLHALWWRHYGAWLFDQRAGSYRCAIGKTTHDALAALGVPFENWIYQPQGTRGVAVENQDHGWPELLAAVARDSI